MADVIEKDFRSRKAAEIWAEIFGYEVIDVDDYEDDLGIVATLIKTDEEAQRRSNELMREITGQLLGDSA